MVAALIKNVITPWEKETTRLTMFGWKKKEKKDRMMYPIRYCIIEDFFKRTYSYFKYEVMAVRRFIKYLPYTASNIPTGKKCSTYQPDISLILHAAFHYFQKIVESNKEDSLEYYRSIQNYPVESEKPEVEYILLEHKKTQLTQCLLYNWWTRERPQREDPIDTFYTQDIPEDFNPMIFYLSSSGETKEIKKHKYYDIYLKWLEVNKISLNLNKEWREEDAFMLKTLISFLYKVEW